MSASIKDIVVDLVEEQALCMDGFDDCILGVCDQFGRPTVVAYDLDKVLKKIQRELTPEEAMDFWSFNQVGAWMGDFTPVFVRVIKKKR